MKRGDIRTLQDLIDFGIGGAGEDENYLYIYEYNPNRGYYDSSFFLYDKKKKELKHIPDDLEFIDSVKKIPYADAIGQSTPISDIEYIKSFA